MNPSRAIDATLCPRCSGPIDVTPATIGCSACGAAYPRFGGIPVLLANPEAYLESCAQQVSLLEQQTELAVRDIEEQIAAPDVLAATKERCTATIDALRQQAAQVVSLMPPPGRSQAANSDSVAAPLQYIHYLYRDWGWGADTNGENERVMTALESVRESRPLGRTLVIGAGGCRLAYDLHRCSPGTETVVLDIEPFLFTVAHEVIRGGRVSLLEANAEIDEASAITMQWTLTAPDGPLGADEFHFLLADGLEPPFKPGTFDTVVTPWFIDIVPPDLRDFMSTIYRMLKPEGQWLNAGPLHYWPDLPTALRFTREELFDLAARAGLRVGKWRTETMPYLVSKLNGRGKVERVISFAARKIAEPERKIAGPPAWLLFRHLPVPTFSGQSLFYSKAPLVQLVVSSIDGQRTLDDLATLVAKRAQQPDLTIYQIRVAVRRCLAEIHPECS